MLTRALAVYALAVTLALVGAGLIVRGQRAEVAQIRGENATLTEALNRAAKQREQDRATLARRASANAATARAGAAARASLAESVRREQEWADTPVPDSIRAALEGTK